MDHKGNKRHNLHHLSISVSPRSFPTLCYSSKDQLGWRKSFRSLRSNFWKFFRNLPFVQNVYKGCPVVNIFLGFPSIPLRIWLKIVLESMQVQLLLLNAPFVLVPQRHGAMVKIAIDFTRRPTAPHLFCTPPPENTTLDWILCYGGYLVLWQLSNLLISHHHCYSI